MSQSKIDIPVVINGKVYTLSGYEGEDYLQNIATYINNKISECKASEDYRRMNSEYQGVLLALNIADDYFKARSRADEAGNDNTDKEQQLYELRHEVIESQIKHEAALKLVEEYKEQVAALQRKVVQLEAERGQKEWLNRKSLHHAVHLKPLRQLLYPVRMQYIWQVTNMVPEHMREILVKMCCFPLWRGRIFLVLRYILR